MPLTPDAAERIREQLERIQRGERVSPIVIGYLTTPQHQAILAFRSSRGLTGGESPEVLYVGRHHYASRVAQGYSIPDLTEQIEAGMADDAIPFLRGTMTSLQAAREREDGHGKLVRDLAVFELTARKPRVELFSVIPKGDGR